MVVIEAVDERSPAARLGLQKGDRLVSLNRQEINDVLDYEFYANDSGLRIEYLRGDERRAVSLWHRADEPLGLRFSTYLMDEKRRCRNSCIFCFIDQNPRGLRESLYFKDDDERLSFLHGNYITLTNLAPAQIERIVKMRISPINVSVHTTDPELRVRMMRNKDAGRVLGYLDTLAAGGIALNVQLVLCHTVNDGGALARSLDDLLRLDTLASVACVPAGLTAHRANLTPLTPFDRESACAVLDLLDEKAPAFYEKFGARTIYAADEFFLTAGRPLPDASYYEGYPQLENGVGMLRCHADEFAAALAETAAAYGIRLTACCEPVDFTDAGAEALRGLPFEGRLSVVEFLLHSLQTQLCAMEDASALAFSAESFLKSVPAGEGYAARAEKQLENRRAALQIRRECGVLSAEDERRETAFLTRSDAALAARSDAEAFDAVRLLAESAGTAAEQNRKNTLCALENSLRFVCAAFGDEQELWILLHGLQDCGAAAFLQKENSSVYQELLSRATPEAKAAALREELSRGAGL